METEPAVPKPILIVEDDPDLRGELSALLEDEGFQVHAVGNGRDALYILSALGGAAVVLLDLMLPVLSGREVLDWLRRIGSSSPVIVMSATSDPSEAADAAVFLPKPLKLDLLLPLVRKLAA